MNEYWLYVAYFPKRSGGTLCGSFSRFAASRREPRPAVSSLAEGAGRDGLSMRQIGFVRRGARATKRFWAVVGPTGASGSRDETTRRAERHSLTNPDPSSVFGDACAYREGNLRASQRLARVGNALARSSPRSPFPGKGACTPLRVWSEAAVSHRRARSAAGRGPRLRRLAAPTSPARARSGPRDGRCRPRRSSRRIALR
jgi:hypothetical protein